MYFHQLLDSIPIVGVLVLFSFVAMLVCEGGYRIGCWWLNRRPNEKDGPTAMVVGSLLALLGFLLAITMGMASERFDSRRGLVLTEANSVGTTYLRAGYLPEPASGKIRELLREYVALRITEVDDQTVLQAGLDRSAELHRELWAIAEKLGRESPGSDLLALFIESLNETIDLHETRVTVGIYARVPETVVMLLFAGSLVTLCMVGYNAGLSLRRSPLSVAVLILVLGAVITLVVDLDRARGGFLKVSQKPLMDLHAQIQAGDLEGE